MSENKHILRVENLKKSFGNNMVLKDVSFTMDKGETKVIIGPSGTGKSTLLTCINQLVKPDSGTIYLKDLNVTQAEEMNKIRARIGFVFQDFGLFSHLTAMRNVMIGPIKVQKMSKEDAKNLAYEELKRVGLLEHADKYPAQLSGGQKQRVGIARALAMQPELIGEVLAVMKDLADNKMTMLIVTHEMGFARTVSDEIIFMEGGVIVEQGSPEKLFKSPEHERTGEFLFKLTELYGEGDE